LVRLSEIGQMELPATSFSKTEVKTQEVEESGLEFGEQSSNQNHNIQISYMAPSSWSANYKVYLASDEQTGTALTQGWAVLNNLAGEDWNGATVSLVIGSPKLAYSQPVPYRNYDNMYAKTNLAGAAYEASAQPPSVSPDYISELIGGNYKLSLSGPVTLGKEESASYPLFSKSLKYEKEVVWDSYIGKTEKILKLKNDGQMPFPQGVFRIYDQGEFAGEDMVEFTGMSRPASVAYSFMPELEVKKDMQQSTQQQGNSRITSYSVSFVAQNSGASAVALRLKDYMAGGDAVEFSQSTLNGQPIKPEITNNQDLSWKFEVPAGANRTLVYSYKVTNYMDRLY
ncbi:DUF4139 domain-containing protein, partial [Candidatus Parvarchaeota archaeon]|nr:DUF4139 domain-containing protein [Candidatus Parvarchaeota archaeon]